MKNRYAWMSGGAVLAVAAALLSMSVTTPASWAQQVVAQGQQAGEQQGDAEVKVGTYQPQQVFDRYPDREEMMAKMQELQGQMQQASQEGNQEQMAQLQQQMQQAQNQAIQKFQRDVEEAMPTVAQEKEVDLVVTEVVYQSDRVESTDVTNDVIEQLGGEPAPEQPQGLIPGQGQGGQQPQQQPQR